MDQNPLPSAKPAVVGIGASAGGLAALKRFFDRVPADSGLAFVVVVHLSPDHKSHLADLLQPHIKFPVQQVTETTPLAPNHVYIIPPNANLSTIDTHLRLSKLEALRRQRAPIDHFFRTLADTHDGSSIGVILTGTGSDGTLGIKDIKAKGGLVIAQDPNQAEYDGMPQSAIDSGLVDRVLPVEEIADTILRYKQTEPRISVPSGDQEEADRAENLFLQKVFAHVRARTDRDFSRYKQSTVLRRIARRMQLNYLTDQQSYLERLRENPDEARALADDLLITVTTFFRDPDVFEKLEQEIIPKLFEGKTPSDKVRVWSVGCATGEEAYSLAMLLLEQAERCIDPPQIQVFASDLHSHSLERAREGFYPGDIDTDVSAARLKRFFQKENGGYRIQKQVRDVVVFAPHNLLSDPPFSRLDLISCRNLLIYLQRNVQRDVIELFHYALLPEAHLLLGTAETIDANDLFRTDDKKLCLYSKRNVQGPEPRLPVFPLSRLRTSALGSAPFVEPIAYSGLHQRMLERYAPPSILVGPDNTIAHLSGRAGRYLVHPGGLLTANISRLVREELRLELEAALQSVRDGKQDVDSGPIPVHFEEHSRTVVMHVRPASHSDGEGFALILFEEPGIVKEGQDSSSAQPPHPTDESQRILALEGKLADAQRRVQTVVEEYETSQEEMKASNEEMQSTNEELRSTMEELETSKEELQSINEELQTVNQENRHKVEELAQLTGDLQNLLISTGIATLFLDRKLRILRFTPKLGELFNIRSTDRGRPIFDLTHRLGYSELRGDAESVLNRLSPIEREVQDESGSWFLTRVLPNRSADDRIEGVVVTFFDITERKGAEEALRASEEKFRLLFNSMGEGFAIKEAVFNPAGEIVDFLYIDCNPAFLKQTGLDDPCGRTILQMMPDTEPFWFEKYRRVLTTGEPVRFEALRKPINRWLTVSASRMGPSGSRRLAVTLSDVTQRKTAEIARAESELWLRTILEGIPQLVWRSSNNGSWTWASPQWLSFTGQSQEESHGLGWLAAVHPDDREQAWTNWSDRGQTGQLDAEYRLRRASDGAYLWHHSRSVPVHKNDGQAKECLGTSTDIEELKCAEAAVRDTQEQFRLFVENVHEYALVQTDRQGMITSWNPGAERLFGYTSAEVLGRHFTRLLNPEHGQKMQEEFAEVSEGKKTEDAQWLTRQDGTRFWARWVSEPVYDDGGRLRGVAKLMRDETERQQVETTVRSSLAEKEELLKEVHHRVKNNLQVITSLLNLQSGQVHDAQFLTLFEETRNRVQSIASIHEMLYRSDSFSAIELAAYAEQLLPSLLQFYGLQDRVQARVIGDGVTLELERAVPFGLLLNELVSNSLKHGFPGGAHGEVRVEIAPPHSGIIVRVVDTGVGMAQDFDGERSNTLGLRLVRLLARQLGGTVELVPGPGTTFELQMPARIAKAGEPE